MARDQDPAVVARCPDVFRQAAGLCIKYPGIETIACVRMYTTPEVSYVTERGAVLIRAATLFRGDTQPDDTFVPNEAEAIVERQSFDDIRGSSTWERVVTVQPAAVTFQAENLLRAGGHTHINYFLGIIDKLIRLNMPPEALSAKALGRRQALIDAVAPLAPAQPTRAIVDVEGV